MAREAAGGPWMAGLPETMGSPLGRVRWCCCDFAGPVSPGGEVFGAGVADARVALALGAPASAAAAGEAADLWPALDDGRAELGAGAGLGAGFGLGALGEGAGAGVAV